MAPRLGWDAFRAPGPRVEDPAQRAVQRTQFLKNAAMIGGLLFAALDRPSR